MLINLEYVSPIFIKVVKYNVFLMKFWPISFIIVFWVGGFDKILGTNENWGKRSDIVAVMLPGIILGEIKFENILSMRCFSYKVTTSTLDLFNRTMIILLLLLWLLLRLLQLDTLFEEKINFFLFGTRRFYLLTKDNQKLIRWLQRVTKTIAYRISCITKKSNKMLSTFSWFQISAYVMILITLSWRVHVSFYFFFLCKRATPWYNDVNINIYLLKNRHFTSKKLSILFSLFLPTFTQILSLCLFERRQRTL